MDKNNELFIEMLSRIHFIEKTLVEELPQMIKEAKNEELRSLLERHLEETKDQEKRIDELFKDLEVKNSKHDVKSFEEMLNETKKHLEKHKELSDMVIITSAMKVEHLETAIYRGLKIIANGMGENKMVKIFEDNLSQEEKAAEKLEKCLENIIG